MNLLVDLQQQYNVSYLLIAHHLATTRYMAHEVAVMYLGKIVEKARTEELFKNPLHPYARALFSAALLAHPDIQREEMILPGEVPFPIDPPSGCSFHPRCPVAMRQGATVEPKAQERAPDHTVACHLSCRTWCRLRAASARRHVESSVGPMTVAYVRSSPLTVCRTCWMVCPSCSRENGLWRKASMPSA